MAQKSVSSSAQRRMPYPPDDVFDVVADPERQPEWLATPEEGAQATFTVRHAAGPRAGFGARYLRMQENEVGRRDIHRFATVVFEKPWQLAFDDGVAFSLEPDGDGTLVTAWHEKKLGTAIGRAVRRMLASEPALATESELAGNLERIERVIASDERDAGRE